MRGMVSRLYCRAHSQQMTPYTPLQLRCLSFFSLTPVSFFFSMTWRCKVMMELEVKMSLWVFYSTQNHLAQAYAHMRISVDWMSHGFSAGDWLCVHRMHESGRLRWLATWLAAWFLQRQHVDSSVTKHGNTVPRNEARTQEKSDHGHVLHSGENMSRWKLSCACM